MKKVIIDTDIGTDLDDSLALIYALKSKKLDILAITTVHANTEFRAKVAKKLCNLIRPKNNIKIIAGYKKPIKSETIFWTGYEEDNINLEDIKLENYNLEESLKELIIKNEKINLICLGPYSNIANLLIKFPEVKNFIERIYLMNRLLVDYSLDHKAHNTKVDPEAAKIIFESGIPITLITTEIGKINYFTIEEMKKLKRLNLPWSDLIYNNAINWAKFSIYKVFYLYDPITVAAAEDPSILITEKINNMEIVKSINLDIKNEVFARVYEN